MRRLLRCCARLVCLAPAVSQAHSFGTPYVLPVPFWMYIYGCAATLVVTFALMGFLARAPGADMGARMWKVSAGGLAHRAGRLGMWLLRAGAAGCLLITIVAGFIGSTDPADNIALTLFWVLFLLGFAYLTLFVGDLYALIDPWKWAVEGLERLGLDLSTARVSYPQRLGYWPSFLLYGALIWIELFVVPKPIVISMVLLIYTAITFTGAALFGKKTWFCRVDPFSVFFRLIGKLAPVEYRQARDEPSSQLWLRPPFSGVLHERPEHLSVVLFVLFMLSSTTYDSIHETALWIGLFWKNLLWLLQPLWGGDLGKAQDLLMDWYLVYRQVGLLVFPFLYLGVYLLVLLWAKALTRRSVLIRTLALDFGYSLLPIAFAYHFTHYFTWLVVQWQSLPKLLSDPFGFGWNLLGIQEVSAPPPLQMGAVWHTQVAVLLAGHIVSICLAHAMAWRTFPIQRQVVVTQLPLLLLMVVYTTSGLWILSLPLASE